MEGGTRISRLWTSSASSTANDKAGSYNGDGRQMYTSRDADAPVSVTGCDEKEDVPPKPPPKDKLYPSSSPYASTSKGQPSQVSLIPPISMPSTPVLDTTSTPRWYNIMGGKSPMASQLSLVTPQSAPVTTTTKSKFRLPRLKKRPSNEPGPSGSAGSSSALSSRAGTDEIYSQASCPEDSISSPWGFQVSKGSNDTMCIS